jgi:hypothetical protein
VALIRRIPYDFVYNFPSVCTLAACIFGLNISAGVVDEHAVQANAEDGEAILNASRGIQKPIPLDQILVELQIGCMPPLIILPGKHL